jgi:acetyltransferase-like isoleucine patch superfamily enzyme
VVGALIFESPVAVNQYVVGNVELGFGTYLNGRGEIHNASIGRFCSVANGCIVCPGEHRLDLFTTHPIYDGTDDIASGLQGIEEYDQLLHQVLNQGDFESESLRKPNRVSIGNDVWIGANSILLAGVVVGNGSVIGAGSVVTKQVPPYSIVAGNPAKVIRSRFELTIADRLESLAWWNLDIFTTQPIKERHSIPRRVCDFLDHVELLVSNGQASYIDTLSRFKIGS